MKNVYLIAKKAPDASNKIYELISQVLSEVREQSALSSGGILICFNVRYSILQSFICIFFITSNCFQQILTQVERKFLSRAYCTKMFFSCRKRNRKHTGKRNGKKGKDVQIMIWALTRCWTQIWQRWWDSVDLEGRKNRHDVLFECKCVCCMGASYDVDTVEYECAVIFTLEFKRKLVVTPTTLLSQYPDADL